MPEFLLDILHSVLIWIEVLVLFNLIIMVHELGHLWAAQWRGLHIERFAIWFGKPIFKKNYKGVDYCLGWIPAGGYVSLPQMASMESIEGKNAADAANLPPITPTDKMIVAFAGPFASFMLALLLAVVVCQIGRPVSETEMTTVIGHVLKDSPSAAAGLRAGDRLIKIDGHEVTRWDGMSDYSVVWRIVSSTGDTIPVEVERDGKLMKFEVLPKKEEREFYQRPALRQIQIMPKHTPIVGKVYENSPAALAGLRENDIVISANGQKLFAPANLAFIVEENPSAPVTLEIKRGRETFTKTMTPRIPDGETIPRIGILWDTTGRQTLTYPDPLSQISIVVNGMKNTLSAVFSPKSDIKPQHLSGPVGIMRLYYLIFQSEEGWRLALWFSVAINVNLAIMNLLPFPVLDGGHITLAILEKLRGKSLNVRLVETVQVSCALFLMGYMLFVTFFDLQDFRWGKPKDKPPEMLFTPKTSAPDGN